VKHVVDWLCSLWPFGSRAIFPERRQGVRWLTLKNAARAAIVLVVAFFLLSIWSEFRPAHSGNSVLQQRRAAAPEPRAVAHEPYDVVREGSTSYPAPGVIGSDTAAAVPRPAPPVPQKPVEPQASPLGKGQRIVISGGAEGVQVHVGPRAPIVPPRRFVR